MKKKFIVITGANSGIGLATAKLFSEDPSVELIISTRIHNYQFPFQSKNIVHHIFLDLNDSLSIEEAAGRIIAISKNSIHMLFNNAGYGLQLAMEDVPDQSLKHQFQVNFFGPIQLTNILLPALRNAKGKLVFNSSILGFITIPFRGPYSSSKFALEAAANAYRLENKGLVDVVTIQPGPIQANFKSNALSALKMHDSVISTSRLSYVQIIDRLGKPYPSKTLAPESVAALIVQISRSRSNRTRYRVTLQTKIASLLIRFLPSRVTDHIFSKIN